MYRILAFFLLAVTVFACSDASSSTSVTPTPVIASTTTSPPPSPATSMASTTLPEPLTSTTVTTTTTTTIAAGTTSTTLAGEPFDLGPREGDVLGVVGVAYDDVLNVRSGPGTNQTIVATLDPLFDQIVATGRHRLLTRSIWNEIVVGGRTGWANASFMAYLGPIADATSRYLTNAFSGAIPTAATMLDLGMLVADAASSDDPPSLITVTVAPTVGDLGEITVDVVGLGDDAVFGVRLHIFGEPVSDGFSLKTIEEQVMCGRGITPEGLCP